MRYCSLACLVCVASLLKYAKKFLISAARGAIVLWRAWCDSQLSSSRAAAGMTRRRRLAGWLRARRTAAPAVSSVGR
jgi:hypothetical protein